jgi:hypothetical protein
MLDLTALLTKDRIEPLGLPDASNVHASQRTPTWSCQLEQVRGMIHSYALLIVASGPKKDGGAVLTAA